MLQQALTLQGFCSALFFLDETSVQRGGGALVACENFIARIACRSYVVVGSAGAMAEVLTCPIFDAFVCMGCDRCTELNLAEFSH